MFTHRSGFRCAAWAVAATLPVLLDGCGTATVPCGTFGFTGAANANRGVDVTVDFNFSPAACSATCTSSTNAYVQIVRIIDQELAAARALVAGGTPAARVYEARVGHGVAPADPETRAAPAPPTDAPFLGAKDAKVAKENQIRS